MYVGAQNYQSLKPFIENKMHNNITIIDSYATKSYPYNNIVHSYTKYYTNLNVIRESNKKLLKIKTTE